MLKAVSFSALKRRVEAHHAIRSADHPLNGLLANDDSALIGRQLTWRTSEPFKRDRTDEKLVKVQQAKISLMLNISKRELHPRCLLNNDMNSNPFYLRFCGHLSFKPGNTSTKSSGLSPRTISRRIVDTDNPKPMIHAGGNLGTILRLPCLSLPVFRT